jgi:hypothetical protein
MRHARSACLARLLTSSAPTSPTGRTSRTRWCSPRRWAGRSTGRRSCASTLSPRSWPPTRPWPYSPATSAPGLLPEGLRYYDLRHTCASLLIAQGASIKAVQKQLGHKTASITLDTYGHLFPSKLEALRERLEQVREAAKKRRSRYPGGPVVVPLRKAAGQESGG